MSVTHCEDLAYKHVHCLWDQCCGKAVPTSTEYHRGKLSLCDWFLVYSISFLIWAAKGNMEDAHCSGRRKRKAKQWLRDAICVCHCDHLSYKHVHCPCDQCGGKAVTTSTEYRHWQQNMYLD